MGKVADIFVPKKPKPPPEPEPAPPAPTVTEAEAQAEVEGDRARRRRGFAATRLTGPGGLDGSLGPIGVTRAGAASRLGPGG